MENEKYYKKYLSSEIASLALFVALTPLLLINMDVVIRAIFGFLLLSADVITISNIIRTKKEYKEFLKKSEILKENIETEKENIEVKEEKKVIEQVLEQVYIKDDVLDKPKVLEKKLDRKI